MIRLSVEYLQNFNNTVFGAVWNMLNVPFMQIGNVTVTVAGLLIVLAVASLLVYCIQRIFDYEGY